MTLQQFISAYSGKKLDWDGAFQGQCVDLFRFYCNKVLDIAQPKSVNGAADFWTNYESDSVLKTNFTKIVNTTDFKPKAGDVMLWNRRAGGGFGHVGVVSDNNATLSEFTSFDQNWRAINVCELTKHNYTNVYGVLRPVQSTQESMPGELEACMSDRKKFWEERDQARAEVESLKKELEGKQAVIDSLNDRWNRLLERIAGILGCPIDENSIIDFATRFSGEVDSALKYKDMYDREVQARKADFEASQAKLAKFDESIHELRDQFSSEQQALETKWMKRIDNLQAQVDSERERARVAEEALKAVTKFSAFWKLIGRMK